MANENPKVIGMDEETKVPEIPSIDVQEEDVSIEKTEVKTTGTLQAITTKVKRTVNLDLFIPEIHEWITEKLKVGPTLVVGDNIGDFSLVISENLPSVIARESSSTYVNPQSEVTDASLLDKIDLKPFDVEKLSSMNNVFINIIVIFTLRKLEKDQQKQLLTECKRMLSRDGQLIVVGEFYPKSVFLLPITLTKEGIKAFKRSVLKKKMDKPIAKIDKLANELDFKFFDVKYDAGGRVRTYVLTKRWGALVS